MNTDKELIRQWLKSKRMTVKTNDVPKLSMNISDKLVELLNWESFKLVHCYEQISSLREVDTSSILRFLTSKNIAVLLQDKSPTAPLPQVKLDLIIVPTLGFDGHGNRMGWGSGYYDRLLKEQTSAIKVGLSYQNGFVKNGLPIETHDMPLNFVITENKNYKFRLN